MTAGDSGQYPGGYDDGLVEKRIHQRTSFTAEYGSLALRYAKPQFQNRVILQRADW